MTKHQKFMKTLMYRLWVTGATMGYKACLERVIIFPKKISREGCIYPADVIFSHHRSCGSRCSLQFSKLSHFFCHFCGNISVTIFLSVMQKDLHSQPRFQSTVWCGCFFSDWANSRHTAGMFELLEKVFEDVGNDWEVWKVTTTQQTNKRHLDYIKTSYHYVWIWTNCEVTL